MTSYAGGRKPLWAMRRSDRILITLFIVSITVALLVGIVNYQQRTQLTVAGTEEWYRGNEADPEAAAMQFPKTTLELLDTTHPHLFFQSIMFFILCHIFGLTRVSDRWKIVLYVAAFGSVLSEAALPWLIRFASGAFAPLLLLSTSVMSLTTLVLLVMPLREMWWGRPDASEVPLAVPARMRLRRRERVPS